MKLTAVFFLILLISSCSEGDERQEVYLNNIINLEEQVQEVNLAQLYRGSTHQRTLRAELSYILAKKNYEYSNKLKYVIRASDKIDHETGKMIQLIDDLKIELLKSAGENISTVKNNDPGTIIWKDYSKTDPLTPIRLNLMAIKDKDNYSVVTKKLVGNDLTTPNSVGMNLWNYLNNYRSSMVQLVGSYEWGGQKYEIDNPKKINQYKAAKDLFSQVSKMIYSHPVNLHEDVEVLTQLYIELTKREKSKYQGTNKVHWICSTFNDAPLVGAISALTSLQQDILSARALALAHWKSKVSTGEYSFNKIIPFVSGPPQVKHGKEIEIPVMMIAFDSQNQPTVTTSFPNAKIKYVKNGIGYITLKPNKGINTVKGTVSTKNKSGVVKTMLWEYTFNAVD
ncbi:MAG: hypothetical protein HRT57_13975 [Crocinitomicaceae bacterium]|nr:hypothetical protein [Crocinitomicaceae bacterium]